MLYEVITELSERNVAQGIEHSRNWHRTFDRIEFGRVPVVAVLHGAVVGGGLEIAAACHIRVAESSAYYALVITSYSIHYTKLYDATTLEEAEQFEQHLSRNGYPDTLIVAE